MKIKEKDIKEARLLQEVDLQAEVQEEEVVGEKNEKNKFYFFSVCNNSYYDKII
jgi:hypothetical protein